ncbi:MAG TPA: metabolite traffic protein EboE [Methylomirabilota bacterium]|nr:metabolite traffic protein EboE [Methylomirabilota bacterium]
MKLAVPGGPHLTYCTNIHPGETWSEVRANLERHVRRVKASVAPDRPFGVGLRLSAVATATLAQPAEMDAFRGFLRDSGLYVFTINGFPYGPFHGTRVKEDVYLPDWLDEERLRYSDRLAELLAALLPDEPGIEGTVSTVPGAYKARVRDEADAGRMAERMVRHAAGLHRLRERTGKTVSLALEPEPCCHMETVDETVRFFETHLFAPPAVHAFSRLTGLGRGESEAALRRFLGVCFDACHMAVEFEDATAGLAALRGAGIRVGKVQVSAGLRVRMDPGDRVLVDALRPFAEGVYLHQVVERQGDRLVRYLDLPAALEAVAHDGAGAREWRIHFHVPLFREELGPFASTQDYLRGVLGLLRREAYTPHLEVETYTWDVLPEAYRREDIAVAVARELRWVLGELAG